MDETVGGHKNSILSTFMILINFDVMKTYFNNQYRRRIGRQVWEDGYVNFYDPCHMIS